ncbi:MAG: MarR family transcriptional regulator [Candidatus Dormibacteraeota bacterium]|nr:MarR family transcriptional regulator [Candidatus Dormibacteraeota bacterium]
MALSGVGPMSQQELAELIGVDPRNLVGVIDLLQERRLLEREPDPTDRRRHAVKLTRSGRRLLVNLRRDGELLEQLMLAVLDPAERATLHQLLLRLLPVVSGKEELD